MGLEIDILREHGRVVTVRLVGELDAYTVRELDEIREESAGDEPSIDLSGINFIDSAGLSALHRFRSSEPDARPPTIICPPGNLRRVFVIAGLEDAFDLRSSDSGEGTA
jgi:anti-anti-sigma factor